VLLLLLMLMLILLLLLLLMMMMMRVARGFLRLLVKPSCVLQDQVWAA
jgi:hypothetical protein